MDHSVLNLMGFENYSKLTWKRNKTKDSKKKGDFALVDVDISKGYERKIYLAISHQFSDPKIWKKIHEIVVF